MAAPSATEQYILELINDARINPLGNAARYITSYAPLTSNDAQIQQALNFFGVNGTVLLSAFSALTPVNPLAWNDNLGTAATTHSNLMIANDSQSHQLPGEASLGTRFTAAGYTGWNNIGENIYAFATSALQSHAGFMVDWGSGPNGMQNPAGHRDNIMSSVFREIGVSAIAENNAATTVGPLVVTHDLGYRSAGPQVFILGVDYNDSDHNHFYSIGEGVGGLAVSSTSASTSGAASGGYTLGIAAGATTLTYSGGGLASAVTVNGTFAAGTSAKIDIVDGTTLLSSVSVGVSGPITRIEGLGLTGLSLSAGIGNQTIIGTVGADTLSGGDGSDVFSGGLGSDRLNGGTGSDHLYGGAGADVLDGGADIDYARYDDSATGITANLEAPASNTGYAANDTYISIEGLVGTNAADLLAGDANKNELIGLGGQDYLYGQGGDDYINGGDGNDHVWGGTGVDLMDGAAGYDYLHYEYASTGVEVRMEWSTGLSGEALNDYFINFEAVVASLNADVVTGNSGDNVIYGLAGADWLYGNAGADQIIGGTGGDQMFGGAGNDGFTVNHNEMAAGQFDVINDFGLVAGNTDTLYLGGFAPNSFLYTDYNGGVEISNTSLDYSGGILVVGVTVAQLTSHIVFV